MSEMQKVVHMVMGWTAQCHNPRNRRSLSEYSEIHRKDHRHSSIDVQQGFLNYISD